MVKLVMLGFLVAIATLANLEPGSARARRNGAPSPSAGVPDLNVKGSCADAQRFSAGSDKKLAYNGCVQDEMNAKAELAKRWSEFKGADRSNCVEQARFPSPSYVEVLTCLEMSTNTMRMPRFGTQPTPAVGGSPAPGLGDVKPGEVKPGEVKPGDVKPGDVKPGDAKPTDAKPGVSRPAK